MVEKNGNDRATLMKIYHILLLLKDEVAKLSIQIKALRNESKGVNVENEKL